MKTKILCIGLCLAVILFLPSTVLAGARTTLPNAVDLELAGKCLLYSFSYQRMIVEPFGVEGGISLLGSGGGGSSATVFFYTVGVKAYLLQKDASPFLAAGFVGLSTSTDSGPFSDSESSSYGYLGPGFEYRSEGGFLARASVYGLIAGGGFFVWPGVTVGIAF